MKKYKQNIVSLLFVLFAGVMQLDAQNTTGISIDFEGNTMVITKAESDTSGAFTAFYQLTKNSAGIWVDTLPLESLNRHVKGATVKSPFLSYNGKVIYFSANLPGGKGGMDIYYSRYENGAWGEPVNMGEPVNSADNEENPSISADNSQLYFTRWYQTPKPLPDDEICRSVFCSTFNSNMEWGIPQVIKLTSAGCSNTPLISPDGNTLYFSSNRLVNKRKVRHDMFYVERMPEGMWSVPYALDMVNTELDEIDFAVDYRNKQFAVLRFNDDKKVNASSLSYVSFPKNWPGQQITILNGTVLDAATGNPVPASIRVAGIRTLKNISHYKAGTDGKYRIIVPQGTDYKLEFFAPGFSTHWSDYITSNIIQNNYTINRDIRLYGQIEILFNVFDKEMFSPLTAGIVATAKGKSVKATASENEGQYTIKLPIGDNYMLAVTNPNYSEVSIPINLQYDIEFPKLVKDIALSPLKVTQTIRVNELGDRRKMLEALVDIRNMEADEVLEVTNLNKGEYQVKLRKGNRYSVHVALRNYSYYYGEFIAGDPEADKLLKNIELKPLAKQTVINFNLVKFAPGSTLLTDNSYADLDKFVQLLVDNPEITVEVSAHAADTSMAHAAYFDKLTAKQANFLLDYILSKNIVRDRITAKGYGLHFPVIPNAVDASNPKNWRCVYTIITPAKEWEDVEPAQQAFDMKKSLVNLSQKKK